MKTLVSFLIFLFALNAFGQITTTQPMPTSTTKVPETEVSPKRKDIDQEITNPRLRATTGAKRILSVQTALTYNGGSIQDPLGKKRPQLTPGDIEYDPAKITGTVAFKYRMTDYDNLNLGIGVGWLTPTYEGQRGQFENPYIGYNRPFKAGGLQNVFTAVVQKYTADASVKRHFGYEYGMNHTVLTGIGSTKWRAGLTASYTREFYTEYTGGVLDQLAAYPSAEYAFNQRWSFRTVYRGFNYYNTAADTGTFQHDDATQSAGMGIAVVRDCYLYPNIQWVWADMKAEKTTVALSANVNL